jgi:hypothetical protein
MIEEIPVRRLELREYFYRIDVETVVIAQHSPQTNRIDGSETGHDDRSG